MNLCIDRFERKDYVECFVSHHMSKYGSMSKNGLFGLMKKLNDEAEKMREAEDEAEEIELPEAAERVAAVVAPAPVAVDIDAGNLIESAAAAAAAREAREKEVAAVRAEHEAALAAALQDRVKAEAEGNERAARAAAAAADEFERVLTLERERMGEMKREAEEMETAMKARHDEDLVRVREEATAAVRESAARKAEAAAEQLAEVEAWKRRADEADEKAEKHERAVVERENAMAQMRAEFERESAAHEAEARAARVAGAREAEAAAAAATAKLEKQYAAERLTADREAAAQHAAAMAAAVAEERAAAASNADACLKALALEALTLREQNSQLKLEAGQDVPNAAAACAAQRAAPDENSMVLASGEEIVFDRGIVLYDGKNSIVAAASVEGKDGVLKEAVKGLTLGTVAMLFHEAKILHKLIFSGGRGHVVEIYYAGNTACGHGIRAVRQSHASP